MSPEERAALRVLAEAATPGPWEVERYWWKLGSSRGMPDSWWLGIEARGAVCGTVAQALEDDEAKADAAFIAAARTAVPALLDALDEAERERDEHWATLGTYIEGWGPLLARAERAEAELERLRED
jgi:hypothetical protein